MMKKKGFTLMETVISLVLIGILASFIFTSYNNTQKIILRSNLYAEALYIAVADINKGIEVNEITNNFERKTTITTDGDLKLITTTVIGKTKRGAPVEIKLFRYGE